MQTTDSPTITSLLPTMDEVRAQPEGQRRAIEVQAFHMQRVASAGMAALGRLVADASLEDARPQTEQIHTGELIAMLAELESSSRLIAEECASETAETGEAPA